MPKTLLLADDSVTIQKVVGISFANEDVRLITVDNGDAAIARARQDRPDVILADVVMPGKSGYEVCEAVKADPNLRHIPVLLLTGTFEAFDEARAARAGAAGHIAKPFESQLLVEQVKRLLAQSEVQRSAPARAPAAATPPPTRAAAPAARAAAPAAAPAARAAAPPPVPPVVPAAADDSFEFFSDEPAASASPETADTFALDENDSAFAFGDAEISELEPEPPKPAARPRAAAPSPGARTVAILPEEIPITGREMSVDQFEDIAVGGDEAADDAEFAPLDPPTSAGNDAFEFEFDTAPPASARDGSLRVDSDDLAQATVLDPNGASGFDVANTDLEEPIVAPVRAPAPPAAPARPARPAQRALAPRPPAAERFEPVVSPEDSFSGMSADAADEAELAPFAADELDESSLEVLEPPRPAAARRSGASAPAATQAKAPSSAQSVLDTIAPQLRAQIHDTLEKIAWESFSAVTEQIVRQALERVEAIAWEVIPQMAETLVREEIRRMKGE